MPDAIIMRHRTPHFLHVFAGDGYSAGYYSYLWSEVLDADAFKAFEETGDVFDRATASRLKEFVYSAGYRRPPAEAYRAFRGRDPKVEALLEKRGFSPVPTIQPSGAVYRVRGRSPARLRASYPASRPVRSRKSQPCSACST